MAAKDILFPTGRLVGGSLYRGKTTDADGKPLVTKQGPNAGQPRTEFSFALAISKGGEQSWAQTAWGQIVYAAGQEGYPQACAAPTFAWKIVDGDSPLPNRRGKAPNSREGYPGHWVVWFSSGTAPKVFNRDGTQAIVEPDAIKPGYFIQVYGNVNNNAPSPTPGVYMNHRMVSLQAYGPEIIIGPDADAVGFGGGALPAGATAAPVGGAFTPPAVMPGMPGAAPGAVALPGMPAVVAPVTVAPVVVAPNPGFLMPPATAAVVAPPRARQMTAAAQGMTYETAIANGWTDQTLVQHGLMLA